MKKKIAFYLDKWWRAVLFAVGTSILLFFCLFTRSVFFSNVSFLLFIINILGLITSLIYNIAKRRGTEGILTLITIIVQAPFALYFSWMWLIVCMPSFFNDPFADNLKIPTNIPIETPINFTSENKRPDSMLLKSKSQMDFQLYKSSDGLYQYDFWVGKIERGNIYLKAFEVTHNYRLSKHTLAENSKVNVVNMTDNVKVFWTTSNFTIYEGDSRKEYAARFEVWFKPDSGAPARKLFVKNYKIKGWER